MAAQNKNKLASMKRSKPGADPHGESKKHVSSYMKEKQELENQARTDKHGESSKWLVR